MKHKKRCQTGGVAQDSIYIKPIILKTPVVIPHPIETVPYGLGASNGGGTTKHKSKDKIYEKETGGYAESGIHIKKSHKGLFTNKANAAGMGVQEYARHVLANKEKYPSSTVKQANFARNASHWNEAGGNIYEQGYKDDSPYKHMPLIKIPSNRITMQGVSQPLKAQLSNGETHIMYPNHEYHFPQSNYVIESPMQTGGESLGDEQQVQQLLMAYFQSHNMNQEQIQKFMEEFQQMKPEEQQQVLQYIQQELGNQEQPETLQQELQEPPAEQAQESMQTGGLMLRDNGYYQSGGFLVPYQTGDLVGYQTVRANPVNIDMGKGVELKADNLDYTTKNLNEKKKELKKAEVIYERGNLVKDVQSFLVKKGYDVGKNSKGLPDIDGLLGNKTAAALMKYAQDNPDLNLKTWKDVFKNLSGEHPQTNSVIKEAPVSKNVENIVSEKTLSHYDAILNDSNVPQYIKNAITKAKKSNLITPETKYSLGNEQNTELENDSHSVYTPKIKEEPVIYQTITGVKRRFTATDKYDGVSKVVKYDVDKMLPEYLRPAPVVKGRKFTSTDKIRK